MFRHHRNIYFSAAIFALLNISALSPLALAQKIDSVEDCGILKNAYGPFDYTNPMHRQEYLPRVERAHFDSNVYRLERGISGVSPLGDIDYTLRAFPNHHLALDAMARLHRQHNAKRMPQGRYSITCWFERAQRFKPDDGAIPLLYGIHLYKLEEFSEAEPYLAAAAAMMPQSPEAHYNLGLLYLKLGDFKRSREHASKAYELGFPLQGLREQLEAIGQWSSQ